MPVDVYKIGIPISNDTSVYTKTVVGLDKNGTTITIYDETDNETVIFDSTVAPCPDCDPPVASIIDLLASNPTQLLINPTIKVEGRGELTSGVGMQGGYKVTIPFSLIERYFVPSVHSTNFVAIESKPTIHIQKIAPGPPVAIAMATPAMFPKPIVAERAAVKAWKWLICPASFGLSYLPLINSIAWRNDLNWINFK